LNLWQYVAPKVDTIERSIVAPGGNRTTLLRGRDRAAPLRIRIGRRIVPGGPHCFDLCLPRGLEGRSDRASLRGHLLRKTVVAVDTLANRELGAAAAAGILRRRDSGPTAALWV
jgi:hypothetical protein